MSIILDKRSLDHNMTQFDTMEQAALLLALCLDVIFGVGGHFLPRICILTLFECQPRHLRLGRVSIDHHGLVFKFNNYDDYLMISNTITKNAT